MNSRERSNENVRLCILGRYDAICAEEGLGSYADLPPSGPLQIEVLMETLIERGAWLSAGLARTIQTQETSPETSPRDDLIVAAEGIYKTHETGTVKVRALRGL